MEFPVFRAFGAGLAYLTGQAPTILRILWLPLAIATAAPFLLLVQPPWLGGGAADMAASTALVCLVAVFADVVMTTGLVRHLVRDEAPGLPFYLQFGMDELRVLGASIALLLITMMVYLAIAAGGLLISVVLSAMSDGAGAWIILAFLVAGVVIGAVWLSIRLSLVYPAAVAERSLGIAESWRLTAGAFWALFLYYLLWSVLAVAVLAIAGIGWAVVAFAVGAVGEAGAAAASGPGEALFWGQLGFGYVVSLALVAFSLVPAAMAYRYIAERA